MVVLGLLASKYEIIIKKVFKSHKPTAVTKIEGGHERHIIWVERRGMEITAALLGEKKNSTLACE